jgi:hypothetical protein
MKMNHTSQSDSVDDGSGLYITHGDFRLCLFAEDAGHSAFTAQVRHGDRWLDSSAPSPLISGLDLAVESCVMEGKSLIVSGAGSGVQTWQGRLTLTASGWLRIVVDVALVEPLAAAPELVLWLGPLSVMDERQSLTWRQTLLAGPTVNGQRLHGNDLPAAYFYDPTRQAETCVYVPASEMGWADLRFLSYHCDLRLDYLGGRYGIGLIGDGVARTLAAGAHRFVWYVRQRHRAAQPTQWEAQRVLIAELAQLLPRSDTPAPDWGAVAAGTLADLLDTEVTQIVLEGRAGHSAYVRGTSRVWSEYQQPERVELMTHADLVPPLALYLKLHPNANAEAHLAALIETLPLFYRPDMHFVSNVFPPHAEEMVGDLWYFFENALIKLPWVAAITGNAQLKDMFFDALASATKLARRVRYLFPLFVDHAENEPIGSATNYSVGGLYAYGHMLAYALGAGDAHRDEARAALATMHALPIDRLWHEPQQLGFAAAAAALVYEQTHEPVAASWAVDFLTAQLRMVYWDDRSPRGEPLVGMFQACASLLYPAFKENVEALLPWPHLLRVGLGDATLMLRVLDAQRRHNRAFFDTLRDGTEQRCPYIPYENLGTVELPEAGQIGKEIYGAGEVFWLYLLLEGLGRADDPEVLVCSLDLPNLEVLARFPPLSRTFVVFNPTDVARSSVVHVPVLPEGRYRIICDGQHYETTSSGAVDIPLNLSAGHKHALEVHPV